MLPEVFNDINTYPKKKGEAMEALLVILGMALIISSVTGVSFINSLFLIPIIIVAIFLNPF